VSADFGVRFNKSLVAGESMQRDEARTALEQILDGTVEATHIASFLTALTAKGETVEEMTGFVDAMMSRATRVEVPVECVDIVGTGGDQLHSVNISTMASFAVAGAGVKVAKHGNRSATSSVGSADVLEALGIKLDCGPDLVRRSIDEAGFGFFYAPFFHSTLVNMAPIRRVLGFRTIFNVLGPLANPAQVQHMVLGVAQERVLALMADVLVHRGIDRAFLVRGSDGLDELTLHGATTIYDVTREGATSREIQAGDELGVHHPTSALVGGDLGVNVQVFRDFLSATPGAVFDVACANAGLALVAAGAAADLETGFHLAVDSVRSGAAQKALARAVEISQQ